MTPSQYITEVRRICRACPHAASAHPRGPLHCRARDDHARIGKTPLHDPAFCPLRTHDAIPRPDQDENARALEPGTGTGARSRVWRRRILTGAAGLLTWLLHLCPAPREIVRFRRRQCSGCDRRVRWLGLIDACGVCRCMLRAKTAIASQSCPLPAAKWRPIDVPGCRDPISLPVIGPALKRKSGGCGCQEQPKS